MNSNNLSRFVFTVMIVLLFAAMAACAKQPVAPVDQADTATIEEASATDVASSTDPVVGGGKGGPESLDTQVIMDSATGSLEGRTSAGLFPVYFDFDKSIIRGDQVELIEKNAAFMKNNPVVRVRIEGNCDERGTNEYNMALGQRRALSGQKYLVNLGVAESRLDTISYGEEQAINFGHDDLSWSQNRRDDFIVIK